MTAKLCENIPSKIDMKDNSGKDFSDVARVRGSTEIEGIGDLNFKARLNGGSATIVKPSAIRSHQKNYDSLVENLQFSLHSALNHVSFGGEFSHLMGDDAGSASIAKDNFPSGKIEFRKQFRQTMTPRDLCVLSLSHASVRQSGEYAIPQVGPTGEVSIESTKAKLRNTFNIPKNFSLDLRVGPNGTASLERGSIFLRIVNTENGFTYDASYKVSNGEFSIVGYGEQQVVDSPAALAKRFDNYQNPTWHELSNIENGSDLKVYQDGNQGMEEEFKVVNTKTGSEHQALADTLRGDVVIRYEEAPGRWAHQEVKSVEFPLISREY